EPRTQLPVAAPTPAVRRTGRGDGTAMVEPGTDGAEADEIGSDRGRAGLALTRGGDARQSRRAGGDQPALRDGCDRRVVGRPRHGPAEDVTGGVSRYGDELHDSPDDRLHVPSHSDRGDGCAAENCLPGP